MAWSKSSYILFLENTFILRGRGDQPIYFGSFDFELAVEYLETPNGSTFLRVFKVPDP